MNTAAFHKISYGLYVISSIKGEKMNGQIANTVFQVTSEPPTIGVSINKQNLTHEYIQDSRKFSVSVISKSTPMPFIGTFGFKSGRDMNKFAEMNFKMGETGVPVLLDTIIAYIEAEVINALDCGTHTIFIGKVTNCDVLDNNEEPMTYAYYHEVKRGKAPKTAPTYLKEEPKQTAEKSASYTCSVCGYVYNPEKGDPEGGIKPGTKFEDLPDDWTCPVCGAGKSDFEKEG
ncbi:MAG: rubredoxin [Deltaproteobacteria bacterium]|nr:rubredoxin [Deltaproteobacteria bacterium]